MTNSRNVLIDMKHTIFKIIFATFLSFKIFVIGTSVSSANSNLTVKSQKIFRDCQICPELITIRTGKFTMGSNKGSKSQYPAHSVNIDNPFAIGRFEVTFKEWNYCVKKGACKHRPDDHKWGQIKRPVINITWSQANVYLKWLSKYTKQNYRLPSEAEWEYVNRAGSITRFWWGENVGSNNANCKDCKSIWSGKRTAPVGSFKANSFGVFDTTGNVFEWVQDCWQKDHTLAHLDGRPRLAREQCSFRVIRGGSFYYFSKVGQSAYRAKNPPNIKSYWLGFRVLREM